jgi:hypothetical protein
MWPISLPTAQVTATLPLVRAWRHQRVIRPAVAAAALSTCFLVAGCGDTVVVVQAPTTTASATVPPTADTPGTTTTVHAASATGGTLVVTLAPVGDTTVTADLATLAITRLQDRAAALGYDAVASVTADGKLQVTIDAVARIDADDVASRVASFTGQVYLRPVLIDDQFNTPCVTSAPPDPSTTTTANGIRATTTVVGDSSALPDVPPDASGFVPARGGSFCKVGPAAGTGEVFADAQATLLAGSGWGVTATLRPGPNGEDVWNTLASECFNATATCPTRQLAIELDGEVISAPTVQQPEFTGLVQIAGSFSEAEAEDLADVLNGGAIPGRFELETTQYLPG